LKCNVESCEDEAIDGRFCQKHKEGWEETVDEFLGSPEWTTIVDREMAGYPDESKAMIQKAVECAMKHCKEAVKFEGKEVRDKEDDNEGSV
jgi:predicted solute-binding protein